MTWIDQVNLLLEENNLFFWAYSFSGLFIIYLLGLVLKAKGRTWVKTPRTYDLWKKLVHWLMLLAMAYFTFYNLDRYSWMSLPFIDYSGTRLSPINLLTMGLVLVLAWKLSQLLRAYLLQSIYSRYDIQKNQQASINTLAHYAILVFAILFSLNLVGISLSNFTAFASVLGIGIGFGLRNIMNNFVSGLIILFDQSIQVDDRIVIDGLTTNIEKITIRHTIVRTRMNERIIIPNSFFLENKFTNRSYADSRLRVVVKLTVPYDCQLDQAEKIILASVQEVQGSEWGTYLANPQPRVFVESFNDYDISMAVYFWIDSQTQELEYVLPSQLRKAIFKNFGQAGIDFSFPRQDVLLLPDQGADLRS